MRLVERLALRDALLEHHDPHALPGDAKGDLAAVGEYRGANNVEPGDVYAFRKELGAAPDIHFLPKPFSLAQLAGKVKEVLEQPAA